MSGDRLRRIARHLMHRDGRLHRAFPRAALDRITAAVRDSERRHRAELRFVIEGALDVAPLVRGITPRARALELFAALGVWDTADNNGVLVYVQFVDRDIEIVADRGYNACVPAAAWESVCGAMEEAFRRGEYERGALDGIAAVTALLTRHFPKTGHDADELPDAPLLL